MLSLTQLIKELLQSGWQNGEEETAADEAVLKAIDYRNHGLNRERSVIDWLQRYKVLMGFSAETRTSIASQIITFADGRQQKSLDLDKNKIVGEFNKLGDLINEKVPPNATGGGRDVTSLTSKALWCCYPNDVPIFDRNAVSALGVLSRICHLAPERNQSKYAAFVDVWLQVYGQVDSLIEQADLSDCPYKVRALDRLLWYLGDAGFYRRADSSAAQ